MACYYCDKKLTFRYPFVSNVRQGTRAVLFKLQSQIANAAMHKLKLDLDEINNIQRN